MSPFASLILRSVSILLIIATATLGIFRLIAKIFYKNTNKIKHFRIHQLPKINAVFPEESFIFVSVLESEATAFATIGILRLIAEIVFII